MSETFNEDELELTDYLEVRNETELSKVDTGKITVKGDPYSSFANGPEEIPFVKSP